MSDIFSYIRVTDVLFPVSGLGKIDPIILQRAADRGTLVHKYCDSVPSALKEGFGVNVLEDNARPYVESFIKWLPREFIAKPPRFYCDELLITGECDAIYKEDGALVLVDYKTSAKESKTWRLQGSAYCYMARKAGYDIKRLEFVKLSKTGKAPEVFVYEEDFNMFLKCLEIYKYFFHGQIAENNSDYL